jgi:hypothetical protein
MHLSYESNPVVKTKSISLALFVGKVFQLSFPAPREGQKINKFLCILIPGIFNYLCHASGCTTVAQSEVIMRRT